MKNNSAGFYVSLVYAGNNWIIFFLIPPTRKVVVFVVVEKNIRVGGNLSERTFANFTGAGIVFPSGNAEKLNCNKKERERERGLYLSSSRRTRVPPLLRSFHVVHVARPPPRRLLSTPFGREEREEKLASLPSLRCTHPSGIAFIFFFFFLHSFTLHRQARAKNFPLPFFSLFPPFEERGRLDSVLLSSLVSSSNVYSKFAVLYKRTRERDRTICLWSFGLEIDKL